MIFLHGGMPCALEVAAVAPALPFVVAAFYVYRAQLREWLRK